MNISVTCSIRKGFQETHDEVVALHEI